MTTIIITGPSGSGKTFLSNKLAKAFDNVILVRTDSYYKDSLLIKILSILNFDIYDKIISIKQNKLIKTINSINKKEKSVLFYDYDFKNRKSTKSINNIEYGYHNSILILEGIFSHRLNLNYNNTVNIICNEKKEICFKRRLKRDIIERGRNRSEVIKQFNKSWKIYFNNINKFINNNIIISIDTIDERSYKNLIKRLNKILTIKKN